MRMNSKLPSVNLSCLAFFQSAFIFYLVRFLLLFVLCHTSTKKLHKSELVAKLTSMVQSTNLRQPSPIKLYICLEIIKVYYLNLEL